MDLLMQGRVAIITGAGRGIGREHALLHVLRRDRPDFVVLNEVDPEWLGRIRNLDTGYEIYDTPTQGKFGVLLLSRHPIESVEVETFTERWSPAIVARLDVDGQPVGRRTALVVFHDRPGGQGLYRLAPTGTAHRFCRTIPAMIDIQDIRRAQRRLAGQVHRTPVLGSRTLSDRIGATAHLKKYVPPMFARFDPVDPPLLVRSERRTVREREH